MDEGTQRIALLAQQCHILDLLRETGAVVECPRHLDTLIGANDPDALVKAYRVANRRITEGKIRLFDQSRRDFTDKIKQLYEDIAKEPCPDCKEITDDN